MDELGAAAAKAAMLAAIWILETKEQERERQARAEAERVRRERGEGISG